MTHSVPSGSHRVANNRGVTNRLTPSVLVQRLFGTKVSKGVDLITLEAGETSQLEIPLEPCESGAVDLKEVDLETEAGVDSDSSSSSRDLEDVNHPHLGQVQHTPIVRRTPLKMSSSLSRREKNRVTFSESHVTASGSNLNERVSMTSWVFMT